jgi:hypothetical protein
MPVGFSFSCPDRSVITGEALVDPKHGPVIWLQGDGYIRADRLEEFIKALRAIQPGESDGR